MAAERARRAKLIAEAGIPIDRREAVLDELASILEVYAADATAPGQSSLALQGVIDAAEKAGTTKRWVEKLEQRIVALPLGLRFSIFEYQGYRDGKYVAGELPVEIVLARAKELRARIRRDRGRPRAKLATLLFMLLLLFEQFLPNDVTKNGSLADRERTDGGNGQDYLYNGRLLDLVQALLDVEGIEYDSRGAVGRELWNFAQSDKKHLQ